MVAFSLSKQKLMKNTYIKALLATAALGLFACNAERQTDNSKPEGQKAAAPNIILLIGDGMGVPQVSTAYYFGDEQSNFSEFKHIGLHRTADATHKVTDSAAGATAFSTGEKTYKRAIGVGADSLSRETILEYLQTKGYKTGLISLTTITHATPAAFYAHVTDRDMHEEIAFQLSEANVDFVAGGGRNFFGKRSDGKNLYKSFLGKGYHLDTVALSTPKFDKKNIFLLADESMPAKIEGRGEFLTEATTNALSYFSNNESPFFMMIEESYIDWGGHDTNKEMLISEVEEMDKTLGLVLDFVKKNPNTLLVVTADHETGGVSLGKYLTKDPKTGRMKEDPTQTEVYFDTDQHTAELIPVFAKGVGAENFQGIYENNEIYHKIRMLVDEK